VLARDKNKHGLTIVPDRCSRGRFKIKTLLGMWEQGTFDVLFVGTLGHEAGIVTRQVIGILEMC
jgi:hypothetical protein